MGLQLSMIMIFIWLGEPSKDLCKLWTNVTYIHTISVKMAPAWNLVEELQLISVRAGEGSSLLLKESFRRNYFV